MTRALLALLRGFGFFAGVGFLLVPEPACAQGFLPSVRTQRAALQAIVQETTVTGTVVSPDTAQISAEVEGRIAEVRVEVGDQVEDGDVLARLDAALARIDLQRAQAATLEARERLADTERRLEEAEQLSVGNAFARSALLSLRSEVQIHRATLARLEAEQARQSELLARHEVRAPFAGAITRKFASPGEWVSPGGALLELVSTRGLRIDFQVPQEFFRRVKLGVGVEVALDAALDERLPGRVTALVPRSEAGARSFLMLVELADEYPQIIPGMSARALLRLPLGREGVVVPRDALLRHPDGRVTVFVIAPRDAGAPGDAGEGQPTVLERKVLEGRAFAGGVEIVEGVDAGAQVVVIGNEGLRDGQPVRILRVPGDV